MNDENYKQRYNFATSAFSRIYGPYSINVTMFLFCRHWASLDINPSLGLEQIDEYFLDEYNKWKWCEGIS